MTLRPLTSNSVICGVPPAALMPGTGHCALTDSIEKTRAAVQLGWRPWTPLEDGSARVLDWFKTRPGG